MDSTKPFSRCCIPLSQIGILCNSFSWAFIDVVFSWNSQFTNDDPLRYFWPYHNIWTEGIIVIRISLGKPPLSYRSVVTSQSVTEERMLDLVVELYDLDCAPSLITSAMRCLDLGGDSELLLWSTCCSSTSVWLWGRCYASTWRPFPLAGTGVHALRMCCRDPFGYKHRNSLYTKHWGWLVFGKYIIGCPAQKWYPESLRLPHHTPRQFTLFRTHALYLVWPHAIAIIVSFLLLPFVISSWITSSPASWLR